MISIDFMSSKNTDEERVVYSESHNIVIMIINKADKIIKEHCQYNTFITS